MTSVLEKCLQPNSCSSIKKVSWIRDTFPKPKSYKTLFLTKKAFKPFLLTSTYIIKLSIFLPCSIKMMSYKWINLYVLLQSLLWGDTSSPEKDLFSHELFQYVFCENYFPWTVFGGTSNQISGTRMHYNLHWDWLIVSLRTFKAVQGSSRHLHWVHNVSDLDNRKSY